MLPLGSIFRKHGLFAHMFADDVQVYVSVAPPQINDAVQRLEMCLREVKHSIQMNSLKQNEDKTELLLFWI